MLTTLALVLLSQTQTCDFTPGYILNTGVTPPVMTAISPIMCSGSSYQPGLGACPSGQFVTATSAIAPTCAAPSFAVTPSTPSRTLNSDFTPSASKAVFVTYSVNISCTASLAGGQSSTVELRSDSASTPITVRATLANANSVSLAIALTAVNAQTAVLSGLIPAGDKVRLVSSGTCTSTLVSQTEVALN